MSEIRVKSTGTIKLFESDNTSSVTIASPASLSANRTITIPDADVTLGAGVSLSGSTNNQVTTITGANAITGETNLIYDGTRLGVGSTGASADLGNGIHVRTADSGGTARNLADELVLENSGGSGMTILSGTSNGGFINFGDSGDEDIGSIYYDHNANSMHLYTNNNIFLQADSTGAVTKPLQPSFAAYGGEQNGLGQTTWITGVFGTEAFDVNTDYNHSTSTFTAPVTGKYIFTVSWGVGRFSGRPYSYFNTSNRNYPQSYYGNSLSGGYDSFTGSTVADMDANDTCMWQIYAYDDSDWDLSCNYFTGALLG